MLTLHVLVNFLRVLSILLVVLGLIFYFAGYKLIRFINMLIGFSTGSFLGYFIGLVFFMSEMMAFLLGGILGFILAFFAFVHYKYLKGLPLGLLAFIWTFYISFSFLSLFVIIAMPLFFIFSFAISICVTIITYKYEKIIAMLFTSLLGSVMILHNIFEVGMGPIIALATIAIAMGGFIIQFRILDKKFPGRL